MESTLESQYLTIAGELCAATDWTRPELTGLQRADDPLASALALVRHLRARNAPKMGYTAEYVAALRVNATPEFRQTAEEEIHRLLRVPFLGGDFPDGRGTLLHCRAEVLHAVATLEDYDLYANCVAASHANWSKAAHHTIMYLTRYLQIVWEVAECTDEAVLPLLGFLVTRMYQEWDGSKRWGEVMLGTQGHNWYVAQYGATWKAAFLFPEFAGFEKWQALFPHYFEREMRLLLLPDGFTHETSVAYHSGTMDLFLDCVHIAALNGRQLSPAFMEKLYKGYEIEWKLFCPDGGMPPFGDCWFRGPYYLDRARSIAALLGMPEAKWLAEAFDPDGWSPFGPMMIETLHYPSVGEDLTPAYQALDARPPATLDTTLPDSGYYVMRVGWTRASDYAAIEAAAKGNLITSHGHGAIFDLLLYAKGRQITVGNGKGPDGVEDPERSWRHQTMSHTVAVVDDTHHLPLRSVYRFNGVVIPTVDEWISEDAFAYFSGVHEAYERLEHKVTGARRKLFYLRGGYWVLIDRFTAASPEHRHTYQQRFQLGVPSRILAGNRVVTEGEGGNLLFVPLFGDAKVELCPYPLEEDYANPDQLTFTQTRDGSGLFVTLMVPFTGAMPSVEMALAAVTADERAVNPFEITGLEIVIDGQRDVYVDTHMHWNLPWHCAEFAGEERLFHSRMK
jgi:hypothetical protein